MSEIGEGRRLSSDFCISYKDIDNKSYLDKQCLVEPALQTCDNVDGVALRDCCCNLACIRCWFCMCSNCCNLDAKLIALCMFPESWFLMMSSDTGSIWEYGFPEEARLS